MIISRVELGFTKCELLKKEERSYSYLKKCIKEFYDNHPFTKSNFKPWVNSLSKNINQRLINAEESKEILEYLILDGLLWGFPYENVSGVKNAKLVLDAQGALSSLPKEMRKYIDDRFYGFLIVSGVGWTGFAPEIFPAENGNQKKGTVIIINADNMKNLTLNEWLEFRENTAHKLVDTQTHDKEFKLSMNFSRSGTKTNSKENLRHFLIHEAAHIVAMAVPSIHPAMNRRNAPLPISEYKKVWEDGVSEFPFLKDTWKPIFKDKDLKGSEELITLERNVPEEFRNIVKNKPVKFYGTDEKNKFSPEESKVLYNLLNQTCFPSLYSTVDFGEDFAETVTHYYMSYRDKYKYSVSLKSRDNKSKFKEIAHFKNNIWKKKECSNKLMQMKKLFE